MPATHITARLPDTPMGLQFQVKNGRVTGLTRIDAPVRAPLLLPPLFDIQVNGGVGVDLQSPLKDPAELATLSTWLNAQGVARWIPTLITNDPKVMEHNCRVIAQARRDRRLARTMPGIHLEGPHLNPEDGPRGAHPVDFCLPPDTLLFDRLYRAAEGGLAYVTLAPELPGALDYIAHARQAGVRVSLGHHDADAETIAAAVDAGASLCTHLGNAAAPKMHRHRNVLWPQLADDRLCASFIADGHHLSPAVLKTFTRVKGQRNAILVSDLVPIAGLEPGRYDLIGTPVELHATGRVDLAGTGLLAGSGIPLIDGVFFTAQHTDFTLREAAYAASRTPARWLGLRAPLFPPREGQRANVVLVASPANGHGQHIEAAWIEGRNAGGGDQLDTLNFKQSLSEENTS